MIAQQIEARKTSGEKKKLTKDNRIHYVNLIDRCLLDHLVSECKSIDKDKGEEEEEMKEIDQAEKEAIQRISCKNEMAR